MIRPPAAMDRTTATISLVLGICVAIAGFPWFRFNLLFVDTSPMHVVLLLLCGLHVFRGLQVISREWLACAGALLALVSLNLIGVTDDFSVGVGLRLAVKLALCLTAAIGAAGISSRHPDAAERFISHAATGIALVGAGLFYYSFVVLGEQFINVSPGFAEGSTIDRNQSAFAFAFATVAAFALLLRHPSRWRLLRAVVLASLVMVSGSRGAVLAAGLGVTLCAMLRVGEARARWAVVALALTLWFGRGLVPDVISDRFSRFLVADAQSADFGFRDELARIAFFQLLPEAPLTGHGTGRAIEENGRFYSEGRRVDPHSDANLMAIEQGFPGLLLFGGMYAVLFSQALKAYRAHGSAGSGALLVFVPVVFAAMAHGFAETQIDLVQIWLCWGMTLELTGRLLASTPAARGAVRATWNAAGRRQAIPPSRVLANPRGAHR